MEFETVSGAAVIALATTLVFALLARSWQALARLRTGGGTFTTSIMPEAAQRFRDEIELLSRKQAITLTSGFVFSAIFLVAYWLVPNAVFAGLPAWQFGTILAICPIAGGYAAYRVLQVILARRRLELLRDANIAIAQGLQKLNGNLNRVFHEVPVAGSTIDHVVVGLHGTYAVHAIARRPGKHKKLRLHGDRLLFAPGKHSVSVAPFIEQSDRLARELRKTLKLSVRVRTVLAVPGWEVEEQSGDTCLVVNERNLVMLRGWKDPNDHLMHEDVEKLHELLTERCTGTTTARDAPRAGFFRGLR